MMSWRTQLEPEERFEVLYTKKGLLVRINTSTPTIQDRDRLIDLKPELLGIGTGQWHLYEEGAPKYLQNLDVLRGLTSVKSLALSDYQYGNIDAINELASLNRLVITFYQKGNLDFAKLGNLRTLQIPWTKNLKNAECLVNLEDLYAWPLLHESLDQFTKLPNLQNLTVNTGKLQSLDGIESMQKLTRLQLYYLRRFSDLSKIAKAPQITELELYNLPKLESIEGLRNHPGLEKITITYLKNLKSISVLKTCPNLKEANISRIPAVPQHEREWAEAKFGKGWRLP